MSSVLRAVSPYAYVYADNNGTHKRGKVYPNQVLEVKAERGGGYWIKEPVLDREQDDRYNNMGFWVFKAEVQDAGAVQVPPAEPVPGEMELAQAIITVLRWLKS